MYLRETIAISRHDEDKISPMFDTIYKFHNFTGVAVMYKHAEIEMRFGTLHH